MDKLDKNLLKSKKPINPYEISKFVDSRKIIGLYIVENWFETVLRFPWKVFIKNYLLELYKIFATMTIYFKSSAWFL